MPQPSCPVCLESPANTLREHHCDELSASFITALTSCPFCAQLIGDAPAFPSPVGKYLDQVKTYQPVTVDYENNRLVAADDGEFVVVPHGAGVNLPIIIPRLKHFTSKRDFYHHYQDYYICENPASGEVIVIHPATVEKTQGGWSLKEVGKLEVLDTSSQEVSESPVLLSSPMETNAPSQRLVSTEADAEAEVVCSNCGSSVSSKYTFCWQCGKPLDANGKADGNALEIPSLAQATMSAQASQMQTDASSTSLSSSPALFSSTMRESSAPSGSAVIRIVILVVIVGLAAFAVVSYLLLRSTPKTDSGSASAASNQAFSEPAQNSSSTPAQTRTTVTAPAVGPPDDELNKLRERRASMTAETRPELLEELESAENKYPGDYRFPYERAKLSIIGTHEHDEAFGALFRAAGKAIDNGQADEMLNDLMRDESADFNKLARGHREWKSLEEALKKRDKGALQTSAHH